MKKFLTALLCAILSAFTALAFTACGTQDSKNGISVYMPDGAPALALAKLMAGEEDFGREIEYNVVDSNLIQTYVTGENPAADVCILPVNAAVKLLGSGENYKLLGEVTHGNLYLLKKTSEGLDNITTDNLDSLLGKTVGVINLANVPGLTLEVILADNNLPYNILGNDDAIVQDKVNLKSIDAAEVLPTDKTCDYYVVPEPAATMKINATGGKLALAGDLQELYGGENGYPQAVLVAKTSLIDGDAAFIADFIGATKRAGDWLLSYSTSTETVVNAVKNHLTDGLQATFSSDNLSKSVILNCAIGFVEAVDCKDEITAFMQKVNAVSPTGFGVPADAFFYSVS